jgi:hypothetical protein
LNNHFIDHRQNYFQIATIQIVPLGISVILMGQVLAKQFGAGVAICSMIVANLILWLIATMIISMAYATRSNAVQNVNDYFGKVGAYFKRIILIFAFMFWFPFQIQSTLPYIDHFFSSKFLSLLGVGFGLLTALFSIGGIRFIKWSCVVSFPIVLVYYLYAIFKSGNLPQLGHFRISIPAVVTSVIAFLPFTINSPTFFRHSRSRADSYFALTLITLFISLIQISTISIQFSYLNSYFNFIFISWILISANLLSIYLASASFEGIQARFQNKTVYFMIGCLGTIAYIMIPISNLYFQNLLNSFIASQGAVLCIAFFIHSLVGYKPQTLGKNINLICWLLGCLASTILFFQNRTEASLLVLAGVGTSIISFFCILFLKENIWAFRKFRVGK